MYASYYKKRSTRADILCQPINKTTFQQMIERQTVWQLPPGAVLAKRRGTPSTDLEHFFRDVLLPIPVPRGIMAQATMTQGLLRRG
jgi:hypothetical protein